LKTVVAPGKAGKEVHPMSHELVPFQIAGFFVAEKAKEEV
jgi:hypothetical protein